VRIAATVRPGRAAREREKRTGQQKNSQKCYISHILGGSPSWADSTLKLHGGCTDVRDVITCAKFQIEIFMGYDFTGDRIFDFPVIFAWALQQCSANVI